MIDGGAKIEPPRALLGVRPEARPLLGWSARALEAALASACSDGDGLTGAHCIHELWMRGTIGAVIDRSLDRLWTRASASIPEWLPMRHIAWLPDAYEIAASLQPATRGRTGVYLILLDYADSSRGPYGIYVGASRHAPADRFDQHKSGIRASGAVLRRGLEPLLGPAAHLRGMSRKEAETIEEQLAEALRARGLIVKGGH
ncbi:MAG TPA: hypothetical protein VLT59_13465 [Steroidobacteraceae bacterium]|nr:hypothetical protein [Steroidobacteraceae bacterium]